MATGIGSLPFVDAQEAVSFVFDNIPEIPHWPQLPQRDEKEGFINQYMFPLLAFNLVTCKKDKFFFNNDKEDWSNNLTKFYEYAFRVKEDSTNDFKAVATPKELAQGFYAFTNYIRENCLKKIKFLKGQVIGPVTIGLQVLDSNGNPSFYNDELRDILLNSLGLQALWQISQFKNIGYTPIIFFDDPAIYSYGQSSAVGLSGDVIRESLKYLCSVVQDAGAKVGVHACAGVDWSLVFNAEPDIVNVDVYSYFTSLLVYTEELTQFLEKGGTLAWGIVPTGESVEKETPESLWQLFEKYCDTLASRGVPIHLLKKQWILTPSCGTGTLDIKKTSLIYKLLKEMVHRKTGLCQA